MKTGQIKDYPYVSEGLENRIKAAANLSGTYDELVEGICTKRYKNQNTKNTHRHTDRNDLGANGHIQPS